VLFAWKPPGGNVLLQFKHTGKDNRHAGAMQANCPRGRASIAGATIFCLPALVETRMEIQNQRRNNGMT